MLYKKPLFLSGRGNCAGAAPIRGVSLPYSQRFQLAFITGWVFRKGAAAVVSCALPAATFSRPFTLFMSHRCFTTTTSKYVIPADPNQLEGKPRELSRLVEERLAVSKKCLLQPRSEESTSAGSSSAATIDASGFPLSHIRNVSVVAHVDHGKTTLTDAILRWAGLLPRESAVGTYTDRLQVERERGITVKAQTCSIVLKRKSNHPLSSATEKAVTSADEEIFYLINLVDTPGHADFQYEVSRSLRATEGALLLVDANQGVQAQTLAQYHAVLHEEVELLPVLTKLDVVTSDDRVDKTMKGMGDTMGIVESEVLLTSAKKMQGVEALFQAIIDRVPPPRGRVGFSDFSQLPLMFAGGALRQQVEDTMVPFRGLLFDCWTAECGGMREAKEYSENGNATAAFNGDHREEEVYGLIRVIDGTVSPGANVFTFHTQHRLKITEVGVVHPSLFPLPALTAGMVGYVVLKGLRKDVLHVGETLCALPTSRFICAPPSSPESARPPQDSSSHHTASLHSSDGVQCVYPVAGFRPIHPVVFAGVYPDDDTLITSLSKAVQSLCLNDPAVTVHPIKCQALGAGLQLGFLGLLHLQVFMDRLLQEFRTPVLVTPPQVQYMYVAHGEDPSDPSQRKPITVENWRWAHEGVKAYLEPVVLTTVVTPLEYYDLIHQAALRSHRAVEKDVEGLDDGRMLVRYWMPLEDLARGFFSTVKALSHGYATLEYEPPQYREAELVKVDIIIHKAKISALSFICSTHEAGPRARTVLHSLKTNLKRCNIDLPLQAVLGQKVIARETIKAYRKDVTAKIHAGDISRKQKKWNDQKKGKQQLAKRTAGTVTLDQSVLSAAMGATLIGK